MHPAVVERDFRDRTGRLQAWGAGLLVAAALCWAYAAWEVFVPFTSTYGHVHCSAPAFADHEDLYSGRDDDAHDRAEICAQGRDWPGPVTALVLAAPLSAVGGLQLATVWAGNRLREHEEALLRAEH
ncbi:hypothetical protein [Streptomyces sp. NBC_01497]|uniref:hypothetical protein n=1 Tax=Streptomyces sp. NBC_01497 TaxID=2903885 RepID=UPI002E322305|nr:hypothetical protein [Streptomyces sp. NBC_01497]